MSATADALRAELREAVAAVRERTAFEPEFGSFWDRASARWRRRSRSRRRFRTRRSRTFRSRRWRATRGGCCGAAGGAARGRDAGAVPPLRRVLPPAGDVSRACAVPARRGHAGRLGRVRRDEPAVGSRAISCCIDDHINLLGDNPLIGPNLTSWARASRTCPSRTTAELRALAQEVALELGIRSGAGVYVAVRGPNLETRAEYRMLRGDGRGRGGDEHRARGDRRRHMGHAGAGGVDHHGQCLPDALEPAAFETIIADRERRAEPKAHRAWCGACWGGCRRPCQGEVTLATCDTRSTRRADHELEQEILARWREEDLFRARWRRRQDGEPFVFFEGPPTANGQPGHPPRAQPHDQGPVLPVPGDAGLARDADSRAGTRTACRSRSRSRRSSASAASSEIEADRRRASSTALPRERLHVQGGLGAALASGSATGSTTRRPYITYTPEYIESVWWSWSSCTSEGCCTAGTRACRTARAAARRCQLHEVAQGYEEVLDPSLYFLAPLVGAGRRRRIRDGRAILVWTTTPWTLVSNTALAVHPELDVRRGGATTGRRADPRGEARVEAVLGGRGRARSRRRYAAPMS